MKDYQGENILVALNFSDEDQAFEVPPSLKEPKLNLIIANEDRVGAKLSAWEARAYLVE
jgi:hypothetical protein